jgi:hypothetical protein
MERDFGQLGELFMDLRKLVVLSVVGVAAVGCAPKKIPGTDINDNDDTRAILDVIESYRRAFEKKDTKTIVALLDEGFREDGGSSTPDDDIEYKDAGAKLQGLFNQAEDMRLDLSVRKIEFDDKMVKARAVYSWNSSFKLPSLSSRPQAESEIKMMTFRWPDNRKKTAWRITSGI